jgi:AcrR family transcriptional regulator
LGLRAEKKQRVRREIMDSALALFREHGYDRTPVSAIAARADVSDATFFNYFATKDQVLDDLALAQVELFIETLRYEIDADDKSVPDRIRETMSVAAEAIASDREFQEVLYTRSNLFHSDGLLRERTHEMYRLLAALFERGQQRGEVRLDADPVQLAELLIAMYHLTTINWLIGWWSGRQSLKRRIGAAVDIFLSGCLAENRLTGD